MLKDVKILREEENSSPVYVKTKLVTAERDGKEFKWEVIESHDSVHVLVNNTETRELMFVSQVRVPVLLKDGSGVTIECCAGLVDKDADVVQIAKEEILEELGYDVSIDEITPFRTYRSSVGTQGSTCYTFFADVDESMKVSEGGGLDNEDIEVVRIPYDDVLDFLYNFKNTDATTLMLVNTWFFLRYH